MSLGAILVGIAAALVTVAYVTRPFRRNVGDGDRIIEHWVAHLPTKASVEPVGMPGGEQVALAGTQPVNFCPYCGRRVALDHHFCPGCGKPLPQREVKE